MRRHALMVVADIINAAVSGAGRALAWLAGPRRDRQPGDKCRCGHARGWHDHYTGSTACANMPCPCQRFHREAGLPAQRKADAA